jgi:hypothetical protein
MADKAVSKLTQVVNHAVIGNCSIVAQKGSGTGTTNSSLISALQIPYASLANAYAGGSNAYGVKTVSSDRITPPVQTVHDIWYDVYPRTWTSAQSTVYVINESAPMTLIKAPMIYVKQSNIWKQVTEAWIKDSGAWKQFLYSPLAFTARALLIGGGGSGATGVGGRNCGGNGIQYAVPGGGGGGGGFIDSSVEVFYSTTYNITVGGGGGGNSVFNSVIAYGGGNGGGRGYNGANGGCGGGGGGGWSLRDSVGYSAGAGSQGYSGAGGGATSNYYQNGNGYSGGGGGAGSAGSGTTGGAGRVSDITGSSVTYCEGGNGVAVYVGRTTSWGNAGSKGSYGGGGNGGINWPQGSYATNCRDNTGQGGGAGTQGIVIIRCASSINVSTTGGVSVTTVGTDRVYSFTSNGTIRFT